MDELLFKLLEQTPTIIVMGIGLYVLWKEKGKIQKEWLKERADQMERIERLAIEQKSDIQKLMIDHKKEVNELNKYVRDREQTHIETIKDLITITEEVEKNQESMMVKQEEIIKNLSNQN